MEPATAVTRLRLLDGGNAAFPEMLAAIDGAVRTVWLEVYAFREDRVGERFVHALDRARRRGVRVTVVVDGWGSLGGARELIERLAHLGIDARIYHRLREMLRGTFRRDHRKVLVVDDAVAFLGGINIGDEYQGPQSWADLALEIGGPLAGWLGRKLRGERAGRQPQGTHVTLSGEGGARRMRKRYLKAISRAQRTVRVANAYFLPDPKLVRALVKAARRGVAVQLLLPGKSDVPFARAGSMRLYRQLLEAGVRIHEWQRTILHAKCAVVDGELALLGSFNLDPLSLVNLETLVELHEPRICLEVEAWIDDHLAQSVEVHASPAKSWLDRVTAELFGRFAARVAGGVARLAAKGTPRVGRRLR